MPTVEWQCGGRGDRWGGGLKDEGCCQKGSRRRRVRVEGVGDLWRAFHSVCQLSWEKYTQHWLVEHFFPEQVPQISTISPLPVGRLYRKVHETGMYNSWPTLETRKGAGAEIQTRWRPLMLAVSVMPLEVALLISIIRKMWLPSPSFLTEAPKNKAFTPDSQKLSWLGWIISVAN